jgi:FtsP/CotA-like multicopper oxidase with cupredoxin domain
VTTKSVGQPSFSRRAALAGAASILGSGAAAKLFGRGVVEPASAAAPPPHDHTKMTQSMGAGFAEGRTTVDPAVNGFDPSLLIRDFDWGKTQRLAGGRTLRRYELVASDKEIEIVPGVKFSAWTYNGRIPGPTIRCREGDEIRVRFINAGSHPHTIHFHGIHRDAVDGVPGIGGGLLDVGKEFTYSFTAEPFGLHLYHCHASPLAEHISKGLYGAFIVDPKDGRPPADELLMMQNAFDPNFDDDNEVYAVNTVAFHYFYRPIRVQRDELVRIYLLNIVELDPVNSFHIHGNFFQRFPTGTSLHPTEYTDTVVQGQGQRDVLELRFPYAGHYMFHAHKTEFATLGWMGMFEVVA